ncbi:hypothetical protein Drose_05600 [Dactylosporangium roseum]|uniref:Uncharacterized protein n=1 Tax=Dactylosporangium roseum TaxID=47989 RepID=A0ABY5Z7X3_9ACTN|nr:hypothetical protein [Dactylosporangium roseum]UWZ37744.1 hypothetical protein Drose_05600 [Dactylosporangium roseum]
MDYTAANQAADVERLRVAARQLLTASRPDNRLCSVVLAEQWSSTAPRCPELAAHYVCLDNYRVGMLAEGVFEPATSYTRLCVSHEQQVRSEPGWRWSERLADPSDAT